MQSIPLFQHFWTSAQNAFVNEAAPQQAYKLTTIFLLVVHICEVELEFVLFLPVYPTELRKYTM